MIFGKGCEARESGLGGVLLLLACGGPGPRKEFVEAIVGPETGKAGEDIGDQAWGSMPDKFGCFDERGKDGQIFGAVFVAGEESILACQNNLAVILPISGRMSLLTRWQFDIE